MRLGCYMINQTRDWSGRDSGQVELNVDLASSNPTSTIFSPHKWKAIIYNLDPMITWYKWVSIPCIENSTFWNVTGKPWPWFAILSHFHMPCKASLTAVWEEPWQTLRSECLSTTSPPLAFLPFLWLADLYPLSWTSFPSCASGIWCGTNVFTFPLSSLPMLLSLQCWTAKVDKKY